MNNLKRELHEDIYKKFIASLPEPGKNENIGKMYVFNSNPLLSLTYQNFLKACKEGKEKKVDKILKNNKENDIILAAFSLKKRTGLHNAIKGNHSGIVNLLLGRAGDKLLNILNAKETKFGDTALHYCIRFKAEKCIDVLLNRGASLITRNKEGFTPLGLAGKLNSPLRRNILDFEKSKYDLLTDLKQLHESNLEELKFISSNGSTLLHFAAEMKSDSAIHFLMESNLNPNKKDIYGRTPLHRAAEIGNSKCIEALLTNKNVNLNEHDNVLWTALHFAVRNNHIDCVKILIEQENIDLNVQEIFHLSTPLHLAVQNHSEEISAILVEKGANLEIKDRYMQNPKEKAKLLGVRLNPISNLGLQLYEACKAGNIDQVTEKIRQKAPINWCHPETQNTPLHVAIQSNNPLITELLLRKGANVFTENRKKQIPKDLIQLDTENGIVISNQIELNMKQLNLLSFINTNNPSELKKHLENFNPNFIIEGYHLIHKAAIAGYSSCLEILCQKKEILIDVFSEIEKQTPLIFAIIHKHTLCVKILLENKADVNKCDEKKKFSPLMWAIESQALDILQLLLDYGANLDYQSPTTTILDLAKEKTKNEFMENKIYHLVVWHINGRDLLKAVFKGDLHKIKKILDIEELRKLFDYQNEHALHIDDASTVFKSFRDLAGSNVEDLKQKKSNFKDFVIEMKSLEGKIEEFDIKRLLNVDFDIASSLKDFLDKADNIDELEKIVGLMGKFGQIFGQVLPKPENYPDLVNFSDNQTRETPLHIAVQTKEGESCIRLLLDKGADILATNSNGLKPQDLAKNICTEETLLLLQNQEDLMLFFHACKEGRKSSVELMIKNNPSLIHGLNSAGETALHIACKYKKSQIVDFLIENGADVTVRSKDDETPLHEAARPRKREDALSENDRSNSIQCVQLLLKTGKINIFQKNRSGKTAIDLAEKDESISKLLNDEKMRTNLRKNINTGWAQIFEVLESKSFDQKILSDKDENGDTLLHYLIKEKKDDLVMRLVEEKAPLLIKDNQGRTPRQLMEENQSYWRKSWKKVPDIIEYIKINEYGSELLFYVKKKKLEKVKELILENQVNINYTSKSGVSALHIAAYYGIDEIFELLIQHGADISLDTKDGDLPLHYAAFNGHLAIIQKLCKSKDEKQINQVNNQNLSALAYSLLQKKVL